MGTTDIRFKMKPTVKQEKRLIKIGERLRELRKDTGKILRNICI
jgi:hypothetical protein